MLASKIIKSARRKVGGLSRGFTPSAEDMNDSLEELNVMLQAWAGDDILIPYITKESFTLTAGQAEYSIGSGGDFNTTRPMQVQDAYLVSGSTSYPLKFFTLAEWNRLINKSAQGLPGRYNYDDGDPLGYFRFDRSADAAYTLKTDLLKPITTFTSLTADDAFPDHYVAPVRDNLAVRIAPEITGEDAPRTLMVLATQGLNAIRTRNAAFRIRPARLDSMLQPRHGRFHIDSGLE